MEAEKFSLMTLREKCTKTRNGFSARHKDRRGTSHTVPYYVTTLLKLRCYGFYVFRYMYGSTFHEHVLHIFFYGWMDCRDAFHGVPLLILLCNRQNIAEYETYWFMGVPIINP